MQRVDFYILGTDSVEQRYRFAAKLVEKALKQQLLTILWVDQLDDAEKLSKVFWAAKPESFLAHEICSSPRPSATSPISLHFGESPPDILATSYFVNLSTLPSRLNSEAPSAKRAAEIVIQTPAVLSATRQRYATYKRVCENVQTHKM